MSITRHDIQSPTSQDVERIQEAVRLLSNGGVLDTSVVPPLARDLMVDVLVKLANGHTLTIQVKDQYLTTTEAAEILNVSRPFVSKLLNDGKLPFKTVGTHRRILFDELMQYKRNQDERSNQLMAELQAEAQELNMGY
jgi:excisionase family DNA binding protein